LRHGLSFITSHKNSTSEYIYTNAKSPEATVAARHAGCR
jgi:hypothetical protein